MFVLTSQHSFWWPVTVAIPNPTLTGRLDKQTFEIRFLAMPQDEAIKYQDELAALPIADVARRQNDQLARMVTDWRDVNDGAGAAVPYSEAALRQALQFAWFREGVWNAYTDAINGNEKTPPARLGN